MNRMNALRLFILVTLITAIGGCSDDEKPSNRLIVDGVKYPIAHGYIREQDTYTEGEESGTMYKIILTSKNLTVDQFGGFSGEGHYVEFNLLSTEVENLVDGTYEYIIEVGTFGDMTYFGGAVGVVADSEDAELWISGSDPSSLTLTKKGDTFKIKYTLTAWIYNESIEEEVAVTGTYEGKLEEFSFAAR